jgi:hypothetical protein
MSWNLVISLNVITKHTPYSDLLMVFYAIWQKNTGYIIILFVSSTWISPVKPPENISQYNKQCRTLVAVKFRTLSWTPNCLSLTRAFIILTGDRPEVEMTLRFTELKHNTDILPIWRCNSEQCEKFERTKMQKFLSYSSHVIEFRKTMSRSMLH